MGLTQSIPRVNIPQSTFKTNENSKVRPLVKQSQQQQVNSRNAVFNDMYQHQNTLAKRSVMEKIHFNR